MRGRERKGKVMREEGDGVTDELNGEGNVGAIGV